MSISVILSEPDKLSHFFPPEAKSFLWRVLAAAWKVSVSELYLNGGFVVVCSFLCFKGTEGCEFATSFTNTILDVIPPSSIILQWKLHKILKLAQLLLQSLKSRNEFYPWNSSHLQYDMQGIINTTLKVKDQPFVRSHLVLKGWRQTSAHAYQHLLVAEGCNSFVPMVLPAVMW